MKTKRLIELLQEADPTGEVEVCVGNQDILAVYPLPAYWDGTLQVFERNDKDEIVGAKFKRTGGKVMIHDCSIQDILFDNPTINIDYSELPPDRAESTKKHHAEYLKWCKNLDNTLEFKYFKEWASKKVATLTEDLDNFDNVVQDFFDKNINPDNPLPLGNNSYYNRRMEQWDSLYNVVLENGWIKIKRTNE